MILVGIGGASCSGKSTLSNWLSYLLDASIIHQDKYYKKDSEIPSVDGVLNWDCPEALENSVFVEKLKLTKNGINCHAVGLNRPKLNLTDISPDSMNRIKIMAEKIKNRAEIVLVDGFLIYHNPELIQLFDIKFFMNASFDTLQNRRMARGKYATEEGFWIDPDGYFSGIVWPNYLEHNRHVFKILESCDPSWISFNTDQHTVETCVENAIHCLHNLLAIN